MTEHIELGKIGEEVATGYLQSLGYIIHNRNWRSGRKEIDIVAEKNNEIVIVEVKTRKDCDYALPEDAVDARKIRKIVSATDAYLRKYQLDKPVRFDIITLVGTRDNFKIEHIEEAFYPPIW